MRWRLLCLLLVAMFATACDCDRCDDRSGTYLVSYNESSGDCGALPTVRVEVTSSFSLPASCTDNSTITSDNCTVQLDVSCSASDGSTDIQRGSFEWDCDGDEAEGSLEISQLAADGTQVCASVYAVTYTRE